MCSTCTIFYRAAKKKLRKILCIRRMFVCFRHLFHFLSSKQRFAPHHDGFARLSFGWLSGPSHGDSHFFRLRFLLRLQPFAPHPISSFSFFGFFRSFHVLFRHLFDRRQQLFQLGFQIGQHRQGRGVGFRVETTRLVRLLHFGFQSFQHFLLFVFTDTAFGSTSQCVCFFFFGRNLTVQFFDVGFQRNGLFVHFCFGTSKRLFQFFQGLFRLLTVLNEK